MASCKVSSKLFQIVSGGNRSFVKNVSYAYFTSFISLLNNMELIKQIYMSAARDDPEKEITKGRHLVQIYLLMFVYLGHLYIKMISLSVVKYLVMLIERFVHISKCD